MPDDLNVNINNRHTGNLSNESNQYLFTYNTKDKNDFLSLTMPIRNEQYLNNKLHPIFEMHLPEGYLLSVIKKHFSKLQKTDDFGLLKIMSNSINGRVSYEEKKDDKEVPLELNELLNPSSSNLFEELVSRFALKSALSGVQPKVMASIQNKATLKYDDYIIKSWGREYPHLALNEYYCMQIVKYASIKVPEYYLSKDDNLFIMKRFDILEDGTKLGFEDMCVLQAKQRDDKYEGTYEQIVKTIKTFVSPKYKKRSLQQFFKMIVINNIIQNGDAHLKNFGLVYTDITNIKLAPAYDVVSTTAYIQSDIPAWHLLGSKKWWDKKYLLRFGIESCELKKSEVENLYCECIDAIKIVEGEIQDRMRNEKDDEKLSILKHLNTLLSSHVVSKNF